MRNLKRALSLALAAVMVTGMMVVGASAASYNDFTDKAEITHKDAVSMITELGVLAGLPDGSFGATQNIDRASFARLVCVVLNGGKEPTLGNLTTSFTDTKGNWAEKYIAYCVDQGIIAGRGDGTFAPSANVTGSEAAKMLLVALGYNATYEGIGGATWQTTTDVRANQAGLYTDLADMNTSAPLTRDNAAQMIYNALNAIEVKYELVPAISADGQISMVAQRTNVTTSVGGTTRNVTMLSDKFGVAKYTGVVLANEYGTVVNGGSALASGKASIQVTAINDIDVEKVGTGTTYTVPTTADMLGKEVDLFVKTSNNQVVGSAVVSSDMKVCTITDGVSKNSGSTTASGSIGKYLSDNDLKFDANTKFVVNYDGKVQTGDGVLATDDITTGAGAVLTLVDNNQDGVVDYALKMQKSVGEVTVYNAKANDGKGSITVADRNSTAKALELTNVKFADVVGVENVAKGDIVLYYKLNNTYYIEKAQSFEGKVTAIKGTEITVDGTVYAMSGLVSKVNEASNGNNLADVVALGKSNTFYVDNYNNIIRVANVEESSSYLIVTAKSGTADEITGLSAKVVLDDATTAVVKISAVTTDKKYTDVATMHEKLDDKANTLYSYTVKSDGSYELTALTADTGITGFTTKAPALADGTTVTSADNQTIFIVKTGDSTYTKYVGVSSAPSFTANAIAYAKSGSVADIVFVNTKVTSSSDANAVFIASATPTAVLAADGTTTVYQYPAVVKGEVTTVTAKDKTIFNSGVGYYGTTSVDADGIYTNASDYAAATAVTSKGDGVFTLTGDKGYTYGSDVKVFFVSTKGEVSESSIENVSDSSNNGTASKVVVVTKDTTGTDATVAQYVFIIE